MLSRINTTRQRKVLLRLSLETKDEGCGDWRRVIRNGDPRLSSDIAGQRMVFTPFCRTWSLQVKLRGHQVWQSVRCVRHEDVWHGECHWIFVPEDEGPPLTVNTGGVLVTGGPICAKNHRLSQQARGRREYLMPADVIHLNPVLATVSFSIAGYKVRRCSTVQCLHFPRIQLTLNLYAYNRHFATVSDTSTQSCPLTLASGKSSMYVDSSPAHLSAGLLTYVSLMSVCLCRRHTPHLRLLVSVDVAS